VRRFALAGGTLLLVLGPTALAFFTGGFYEGPRAWAGLGAWLLVVLGAALSSGARPFHGPSRLAVGGLLALAALSLLSILWAPLVSNAYDAAQIVVLYLGELLAASLLLDRSRARAVEPLLAGGALIVIGYGLAGRLLPGILHFNNFSDAEGRLNQPLTYWNAMGELAALGLVLCVRLAGDESRARWMRGLALVAVVPLGCGLYVSFSRGALFACGAGVLVLVALVPRRRALAGLVAGVVVGVLGGAAAAPFAAVSSLSGTVSAQETQGAIVLGILLVLMALAGLTSWWLDVRVTPGEVSLPRHSGRLATGLICVGLAVAIILGAKESTGSTTALAGGSSRLVTLQSDRFDYWRVALRAFGSEPLRGVGAGNWSVYWLRWRTISEGAQDAHSLPLQTLAELGVLGIAALAAFLVGVGWSAARALRRAGVVAAGPIAGLVTYLIHAPLDWDWQMPAVTLLAMVLAGTVIVLAADPVPADPVPGDPAPDDPQIAIGA
jgi:O-antigen ligase